MRAVGKLLTRSIVILAVFLAIAAAGAKPLLLSLAKQQIRRQLQPDILAIKDADVGIPGQVKFVHVDIQKKGSYRFQADGVAVQYSVWSLLQHRIIKLSLENVTLTNTLQGHDLTVEGADLTIDQNGPAGHLYIRKLQYDKMLVENVRADTRTRGDEIVLEALSGQVLNGMVGGGLTLKVAKDSLYLAKLNFIDLDLTDFVQKFDLKNRVEMSGKLSGTLTLNGHGTKIQILNGDLGAAAEGGSMTIKDASFLQHMAQNINQPLNIVVDSLKDYHYNTGGVKLRVDQGDLILDMALDGEAGKRDINVVLHDFTLK